VSDTRVRIALVIVGFAALSIAMTWPLGRPTGVLVPDSDDAYFSIWRMSWVAHQLTADPAQLFDANVFYPERNTLAFSDAMLLVGLFATPLLWLGIGPTIVHNALLIVALLTSAVAAFALARRLGASAAGGVVAGIVFGFAPYRFAHIAHLELQWVVWMPLAMLALQQLAEKPGVVIGLVLGVLVTAQTFSSIYYGVFLSMYLAFAVVIAFIRSRAKASFATEVAMALAPLTVVVLVYGPPYVETRAAFGGRSTDEQQRYSASPGDFLRVPPLNALRGSPHTTEAPDERSLYPGAVPVLLAAVALVPPISAPAATYAVLGVVAIEGTLGTNGHLFPALQRVIPGISSLRSPARFGALVLLSLAMLAAIGITRITTRWPRSHTFLAFVVAAICVTEYWSAPIPVRAFNAAPSDVTQFLAAQRPGSVVLELPVPTQNSLWLYETTYQARSIHHWQPLVNGYSAFAPQRYRQTLDVLTLFPSERSVSYLRDLGVKFVVMNRAYYGDEDVFAALEKQVSEDERFWPLRTFGSGDSRVVVAEFKPR
jgi:hypothetical protein